MTEQKDARRLHGILCTLLGGTCWGFSGACGQFLFSRYGLDSGWLTAVRMISAGAVLILLGFLRERESMKTIWKSGRDAVRLVLFGVLGLVSSQYTYLTAISLSNAGTATVLQYTNPVLILIYMCLRNRKLPSAKEMAAVLCALLGTFLLATHGNVRQMVLTPQALTWGLLAALGAALYTLLPGTLLKRYGSIPVTGYGMLLGGLVMAAAVRVWDIPVQLDLAGIAAVAAICLVGTVAAYTLYLQGVADIGPARAGMLASSEPVSAMVISVIWLSSPFTGMDAAGFALILVTIFLLAKK